MRFAALDAKRFPALDEEGRDAHISGGNLPRQNVDTKTTNGLVTRVNR
jgi:hypothetical protein